VEGGTQARRPDHREASTGVGDSGGVRLGIGVGGCLGRGSTIPDPSPWLALPEKLSFLDKCRFSGDVTALPRVMCLPQASRGVPPVPGTRRRPSS
jgi:hypothetical protein